MLVSEMDDNQWDTYFSVHRSVRYHDRRSSFFTFLHRITSGLTVLMAGSTLLLLNNTIPSTLFIQIVGALSAAFAATDILIGFGSKSEKHMSLKRAFIALEQQMIEGDDKRNTWLRYKSKFIALGGEETSIYRALDILCHNESLIALGVDKGEVFKLVPIQAFTANIFKWSNLSSSP